jgi:hypothetical protein
LNRTEPPNGAASLRAVCCDVAAIGRVRLAVENLPELRRRPGPVPEQGLPANFLKNADEQTVYGLAAVYQAIHDTGMTATSFGRWGVLAAPQKIGRTAMAQAMPRVREEGAWGMSPHLIPHRSLHCVSGAISCALKSRGPNLGVGDGPSEALPTALALLVRAQVEGIWVVLTAFDPELAPDTSGMPVPGSVGLAVALALMPAREGWKGLRLRVGFQKPSGQLAARRTPIDLFQLLALLDAPVAGPRSAPLQDLGQAGRLELWVDGQVQAARQDVSHVPAVQAPHSAEALYSSSLSSHGVEAQR